MSEIINFQPNWYSSPGDTIVDILSEKNIPLDELRSKLKCSPAYLDGLLLGYSEINNEVATSLERTLGGTREFWIKREQLYRSEFNRLNALDEKKWTQELPIAEMIKFGWINNSKISECLNYFDVPDVKSWKKKYAEKIGIATFRKSNSFKSEFASVATWIRQGEIKSSQIECKPWDGSLFEETLLNVIRPLTKKKSPKDFLPLLIDACAKCGVAVAIVRTPTGCKASGATMFIDPSRAMLLLSFRYLSDDQFWFTFFHEAGHLLLHRNKSVFLEEVSVNQNEIEEEKDANLFAEEILIPHEFQSKLSTVKGKRGIIGFAMSLGISPGIVVGQLQHHGFADMKSLNSFKRRYKWEDISD